MTRSLSVHDSPGRVAGGPPVAAAEPAVRHPLTSNSAHDLHRREAVQRSSEPLNAVQRGWERRAARNLLPPQATDAHIGAYERADWWRLPHDQLEVMEAQIDLTNLTPVERKLAASGVDRLVLISGHGGN